MLYVIISIVFSFFLLRRLFGFRRLNVPFSFTHNQLREEKSNNVDRVPNERRRDVMLRHLAVKAGLMTSQKYEAKAKRLIESFKDSKKSEEKCNKVDGEEELPKGLSLELMPRHVAVIMDGNRRWAKKAGLMTSQGHEAGGKKLMEFLQLCFGLGISTVSAFAFSTENWGRDKDEIDGLMSMIENHLSDIKFLQKEEIRVSIMGCLEKVPESLMKTINELEEATKNYKSKHLIMALDYSGRFDILNAFKNIVKKTEQGLINEEDVDEKLIESELLTKCTEFPNPDLLIRTSGEQRISNFFLWQLAYTELFFSPVLWPDFDKDWFIDALVSYQQRERRFEAN